MAQTFDISTLDYLINDIVLQKNKDKKIRVCKNLIPL